MFSLAPRVVSALERIAPRLYADLSWDNVGLLLDSVEPVPSMQRRVGLSLDLTVAVIHECIRKQVGVLVCYHPAIFPSVKMLQNTHPKQHALLLAARHGIAIISPHTALDNCPNGINSWIANGVVNSAATGRQAVNDSIAGVCEPNYTFSIDYLDCTNRQGCKVTMKSLQSEGVSLRVTDLICGMKKHFQVPLVRCALGVHHSMDSAIQTIGICAGSGSSVLRPYAGALDCVISGEISHHEILHLQQSGTTVLLVEHGTSERGYLQGSLKPALIAAIRDIDMSISTEEKRLVETIEVECMESDVTLLTYE